jgi:exonuclease SbcD
MILLHSADWHLGKKLDNYSRLPEQEAFLEAFCVLADQEGADAILLSGDLFDHYLPSNEAVELYYRYIARLSKGGARPVIIIAGNHDSPDHLVAPDPLARALGITVVGYPRQIPGAFHTEAGVHSKCTAPGFIEIVLPGHPPLRILTTPYANALRLREALDPEREEAELAELLRDHWAYTAATHLDDKGCNVLMAHLFFTQNIHEPEPEPDDEKPIHYIGGVSALSTEILPPGLQYVALGHLHRAHAVAHPAGLPVVYSGSPVSYSFAEAGQQKHVVRIELAPGEQARWTLLPIAGGRPLLRYTTDDADAAIRFLQAHPEAFVELTLICDTYLSGELKNRLEAAHQRLFIVPQSRLQITGSSPRAFTASLDNMEEVFNAYYLYRNGAPPDDAILDLFRELISNDSP